MALRIVSILEIGPRFKRLGRPDLDNCRSTLAVKIKNISGSHVVKKFVEFNPFPSAVNSEKQIFSVFDFHNFFDGLIGYEPLRSMGTNILTGPNELKF